MKNRKYQTILADPPWRYGVGWGWGAKEYYPTLSLKELLNLRIPAAENAHLYLWTPNGMLPAALSVMKEWGFIYKTCITWAKTRSIFGYYFKGQTEQLLFGVKGRLAPCSRRETTLVTAPIIGQSQKPKCIYDKIEAISPGPYLELFARKRRRGWSSIGLDINGKDIREILR